LNARIQQMTGSSTAAGDMKEEGNTPPGEGQVEQRTPGT